LFDEPASVTMSLTRGGSGCHPFHHPNGGGQDPFDFLGSLPLTVVERALNSRGDSATARWG